MEPHKCDTCGRDNLSADDMEKLDVDGVEIPVNRCQDCADRAIAGDAVPTEVE